MMTRKILLFIVALLGTSLNYASRAGAVGVEGSATWEKESLDVAPGLLSRMRGLGQRIKNQNHLSSGVSVDREETVRVGGLKLRGSRVEREALAGAIDLLAGHSDGKALVNHLSEIETMLRFGKLPHNGAIYHIAPNVIIISDLRVGAAKEVLAAMIAHEATHALDVPKNRIARLKMQMKTGLAGLSFHPSAIRREFIAFKMGATVWSDLKQPRQHDPLQDDWEEQVRRGDENLYRAIERHYFGVVSP